MTLTSIRLVTPSDLIQAHDILLSLVQNPQDASFITELTIDAKAWPLWRPDISYFGTSPHTQDDKEEEEKAAHDQQNLLTFISSSLSNHLPDSISQQIIQSLTWKSLQRNKPWGPEDGNKSGLTSMRGYGCSLAVLLLALGKNISSLKVYGIERAAEPLSAFLLRNNYHGFFPPCPSEQVETIREGSKAEDEGQQTDNSTAEGDQEVEMKKMKTKINVNAVPALQNLQTLIISPTEPPDPGFYSPVEVLKCMRYFHHLPRLREIKLDGVMDYRPEMVPIPAGVGSPSIKKLEVVDSDVDTSLLACLVGVFAHNDEPGGLEEVKIHLGGLEHPDEMPLRISLKTLGMALLGLRRSLKVLDLDLGDGAPAHWRLYRSLVEKEGWPEDQSPEPELGVTQGVWPPGLDDYETDDERGGYEAVQEEDEEEKHQARYFEKGRMDVYIGIDETLGRDDHGRAAAPRPGDDDMKTRKYGYTIGSLHDFAKLEVLKVSMAALLGPVIDIVDIDGLDYVSAQRLMRSNKKKKWKKGEGANGDPSSSILSAPFARLVDALPGGLRVLWLYDYVTGVHRLYDEQVDELMAVVKAGDRFPLLSEMKGVEETLVGRGTKFGEHDGTGRAPVMRNDN